MQPPRRPNNNQGNNQNRGGMMPRHNNNKNRHNNNRNNNQNRSSSTQGGRINISQVTNQRDKYLNMAKDAQHSGDRVITEYYLQHADHYQRLINEYNDEQESRRQQFPQQEANASAPQENGQDTPQESSAEISSEKEQSEEASVNSAPRPRQDRRQRTPRPQNSAEENASPELAIAAILPPPIIMDTDDMDQAAADGQ